MSAISTVKAPFGAQRHSEIFERHLNFESATLALKRQIWQPWTSRKRKPAQLILDTSKRSQADFEVHIFLLSDELNYLFIDKISKNLFLKQDSVISQNYFKDLTLIGAEIFDTMIWYAL